MKHIFINDLILELLPGEWGAKNAPPPSCLLLLSSTMGITPILDVNSQLILPVYFLIFKGCCISLWHFFNDLNWDVLVTTPPSSIMLSKTPYFLLDFLLMITVSHLKGGLTFPNILPLTFFTSGKVNYKTACTIYFLLNLVSSASVCACKPAPLFDYWAGNLASVTFTAARVFIMGFCCIFLSYLIYIFRTNYKW